MILASQRLRETSRFSILFAVFILANTGFAQLFATERILIPIHLNSEIPGALNSRWVTELAVINTADRPLFIGYDHQCQILCVPSATPPNTTFFPRLPFYTNESVQGIFLP